MPVRSVPSTPPAAVDLAPRPPASSFLRRGALLFALVVQLTWMLNVFPHWKEPNSASRVYLTQSIVERQTFAIDECLLEYGDTLDKASYGGHFYTDKAPGTSFWFVPVAWVMHRGGVTNPSVVFYVLRLLCISLPVVGFWWFTLPWFADWAGDETRGISVVAAGALGTNYLIFATQLFAHVPAGCWLFLAFLCLRRVWAVPGGAPTIGPALLAGALAGFAFLNDFIVMPAVAVLGLASAIPLIRSRFRTAWREPWGFALGLAPLLAVWMAYNWVCFDHPLRTGFYYHATATYGEAYRAGFLGIQWPKPGSLTGMLFSPARGMVFVSPFLVLAPVGWWRMARTSAAPEARADAAWSALVVLSLVLFTMTTIDWRGGWSMGTRYLVPAVPFLLIGVAGSLRGLSAQSPVAIAFAGLAAVGVLSCAVASMTVPLFPQAFDNPLYTLAWPLLGEGLVGPNLAGALAGIAVPIVALAVTLALVLAGDRRENRALRVRAALTSLGLAAVVILFQSRLRPGRVDPITQAVARCEVLMRLGQFDRAAREGLSLADGPNRLSPAPNRNSTVNRGKR